MLLYKPACLNQILAFPDKMQDIFICLFLLSPSFLVGKGILQIKGIRHFSSLLPRMRCFLWGKWDPICRTSGFSLLGQAIPPNSPKPWEQSLHGLPISLTLTSLKALPDSLNWRGFIYPAGHLNFSPSSVSSVIEAHETPHPGIYRSGCLFPPSHSSRDPCLSSSWCFRTMWDRTHLSQSSKFSLPLWFHPASYLCGGQPLRAPPHSPDHSPAKPHSLSRCGLGTPSLAFCFSYYQTSDRAALASRIIVILTGLWLSWGQGQCQAVQ